jgi:hypothetical protein
MDQGTCRPETTVSTLKLTWLADELSISPAPWPGGGCPQASASETSTVTTEQTLALLLRERRHLVLNIFMQQFDFITLFA